MPTFHNIWDEHTTGMAAQCNACRAVVMTVMDMMNHVYKGVDSAAECSEECNDSKSTDAETTARNTGTGDARCVTYFTAQQRGVPARDYGPD